MARVGILALQGGYDAHKAPLRRLGHEPIEVRAVDDLARVEGLIFPGGESTTQLKLMAGTGLEDAVTSAHAAGMPMLATCAGMILVARQVSGQRSLGFVDIRVSRNAYGRQVASFEAVSEHGLPLVFIRAPRILEVGAQARVLDRLDGEPIYIQQAHVFATSFHPELTDELSVHRAAFKGLS